MTRTVSSMWALLLPLSLALGVGGGCHKSDPADVDVHEIENVSIGATQVTDEIPQTLTTPVDILVVLDGSWDGLFNGLELNDNAALDNGFQALLLADPNWRIGILDSTTSGQAFGIIRLKFETFPYPSAAFRAPNPSGPPESRQAVYTALQLRGELAANADFIRPDAHLYVMVLTDNEDASDDDADAVTRPAFKSWFDDFTPSKSKRLGVYTTAAHADYWKERTLGGGTVFSGTSWLKGMETMFLDAIGQKKEFPLKYTPREVPETVQVLYRDHTTDYVIDDDYTYDAETNAITFLTEVPPVKSSVLITYVTDDTVVETTPTTEPEPESTGDTGATTSGTR